MESITSGFAELKALLSSKLSLESDLGKARQDVADRTATIGRQEEEIKDLKAKLTAAETQATADAQEITTLKDTVTAREGEITTLKAAAKTVGQQAIDLVAAQGVPAGQLPAGDANGNSKDDEVTALRARLKTTTDPKEKFKICSQIKELLNKK